MKIRRKKLTLSCSVGENEEVENNATLENIQPVCPDLPKEKKTRAAVANFRLNASIDQCIGNLTIWLISALQKVRHPGDLLNNYQIVLATSIVTPKMVA